MEIPFEIDEIEYEPWLLPDTPIGLSFAKDPEFSFKPSSSSKAHSSSPRFSCEFESCTKSFSRKDSLMKHQRGGHDLKHVCTISDCNEKYDTSLELRTHAYTVHQSEASFCDFENCNKYFGTRRTMLEHRRNVHSDHLLRCDVDGCGKYFGTKRYLRYHRRRMHVDAMSPVCGFEGCNLVIPDYRDMLSHIHNDHSKICMYEDCGEMFDSEDRRTQHVATSHPALTDRHCQYCGKRLSRRYNKEKHTHRVHGVPPGGTV